MDAGTFDDIADVNPHSELDSPIRGNLRVALGHGTLDLHGTTQGFHGTGEQDQQAVTRRPYDPTPVFFNLGFNELGMVRIQLGQSAFIINADQAAVPSYIRHQDGHKSTFDFLTGHSEPSSH